MDDNESLLLKHQLCFPLYACSRKVIKTYRPFLDQMGLTYTQYITLIVLWEEKSISVKELGQRLHLDSGTLTPLLKKLEVKGLLVRVRSETDERVVLAKITEKGMQLRQQAFQIPDNLSHYLDDFASGEIQELKRLLNKVMHVIEDDQQTT